MRQGRVREIRLLINDLMVQSELSAIATENETGRPCSSLQVLKTFDMGCRCKYSNRGRTRIFGGRSTRIDGKCLQARALRGSADRGGSWGSGGRQGCGSGRSGRETGARRGWSGVIQREIPGDPFFSGMFRGRLVCDVGCRALPDLEKRVGGALVESRTTRFLKTGWARPSRPYGTFSPQLYPPAEAPWSCPWREGNVNDVIVKQLSGPPLQLLPLLLSVGLPLFPFSRVESLQYVSLVRPTRRDKFFGNATSVGKYNSGALDTLRKTPGATHRFLPAGEML